VTVKLNAEPAVAVAGTEERTRDAALAELTEMLDEVTERVPSVAVRVWFPTDLRVIGNVLVPDVRLPAAGRTEEESEEANDTVPE
jgi:hypothetical protein